MTVEKVDLMKVDANYYKASKKPRKLELGPCQYLTISGMSGPESESFHNAIEALYQAGYNIKFTLKELSKDFKVSKLEGLWWVNSGIAFNDTPRDQWCWKLMIRMPDFVTLNQVTACVQHALTQKKANSSLNLVVFESMDEGTCIQMMHVGPYDSQTETNNALIQYAEQEGLKIHGTHHEIYISDPRLAKPENLKTIIRYPVQ